MPTKDPRWAKHFRLDQHRGISRYVDAAPIRAHIEQLRAAGASMRAIADKAGVSFSQVSKISGGQAHVRRPYAVRIQAVTPAAILARSGADDFVPAVGARRRVEALQAVEHSSTAIAMAMADGATAAAVRKIRSHPGEWISRTNHERVVRAYNQLWDKPGTSHQTLAAARRSGFASPLAWNDESIDDPGAQPSIDDDAHDLVDEVAVMRAVAGDRVELTATERARSGRAAGRDRAVRQRDRSPHQGQWPHRATDPQGGRHPGRLERAGGMSSKRLSTDQRELMLGLIRDGLPSQEIADAVGVSTSMVHYYAVRHGIDRSRKPAAPPAIEAVVPESAAPQQSLGWQADVLCRQTDPEIFFPEKGGSTKDAKRICQSCPVAAECLDQALANDERFGIWGGVSERRRRKLARTLKQS